MEEDFDPTYFEEKLRQLQNAKEMVESQCSKIQRVAHYLRDRKHLAGHYSPKLVSFGPFHHGAPKLQLGERYKQTWAARFIHSTGQNPQMLCNRIFAYFDNLVDLFDVYLDSDGEFKSPGGYLGKQEIIWMLFVDGCALLYILQNANLDHTHNMSVKVEDLIHVMRDVLLLENQLPYLLLKLLWRDIYNAPPLIRTMESFLQKCVWSSTIVEDLTFYTPTHLLDLQRVIILYQHNFRHFFDDIYTNHTQNYPNGNTDVMVVRYRNIKELKAAGIGLKKGRSRNPREISFSHGWLHSKLTVPEIVVNEITVDLMFNLTAYERCHDFENDYGICSYYSFLDSLIDHPDDVRELKSQGILLNSLRSDEEVANFFNNIGTALMPEKGKYSHVRAQIERHYSHKTLPTWLVIGYHTYFSNPWTIIAFLAAILGLTLTFIQTWYAIHPAK